MTRAAYPPLTDPACADPAYLDLVDAAFERPGGPAGRWMRKHLCGSCPAASACFDEAMTNPEAGVWGMTSPYWRTTHGAKSRRPT
ncbi:MAG TPA: WhiB family transcriptional regulator [Nocardioides sp.]